MLDKIRAKLPASRKEMRLLKNMGILSVGNFSSRLLLFLLVPLYTNVLTTVEYGTYDLSYSVVQILFPVLTLNIVDAVMLFSMKNKNEGSRYLAVGCKYLLLSQAVILFIIGLIRYFRLIPALSGLEALIVWYFVAYSWNQILMQYAKAMEKTGQIAVAGIIASIITLSANIVCLLVLKMGLKGFYVANILSQVVSALYYVFSLKILKNILSASAWKGIKKREWEMLKYSLPLIAVSLSWWVNSALDKYLVAFFCGTAATGLLAVSYKIPSMINVVQQIFIQAWHISGISEYGKEDSEAFYRKIFWWLNAVMCLTCTILILFARPIARVIFAGDFFIAWKYTPFLLISSVLNASAGFIGPILSARKDAGTFAKSGIYGAASNAVLNVVLIYFTGIQGAAVATLISSFVIFEVRRKAAGSLFGDGTYRKILASWGLLLLQGVVCIMDWPVALQVIFILLTGLLYGKTYLDNVRNANIQHK